MKTTATQQTVTAIRARKGFGFLEEVGWEASRKATDADSRTFYRRFAAIARSFHYQLNLAEWATDLLLPDVDPNDAPSGLWADLDIAVRELDQRLSSAAAMIVVLAVQGRLESARIEVQHGSRSLVAVPTVKLTSNERAWIEADSPAVETVIVGKPTASTARPSLASYSSQSTGSGATAKEAKAAPSGPKLTDDELDDIVAVLRLFFRQGGKARVAVVPANVMEALDVDRDRALELLGFLESSGRIQRLPRGRKWIATIRS